MARIDEIAPDCIDCRCIAEVRPAVNHSSSKTRAAAVPHRMRRMFPKSARRSQSDRPGHAPLDQLEPFRGVTSAAH